MLYFAWDREGMQVSYTIRFTSSTNRMNLIYLTPSKKQTITQLVWAVRYAKCHRLRSHLKDTYRSDFHHQISVRCGWLRSYMVAMTVAFTFWFFLQFQKTKNQNQKQKQKGKKFFCNCWFNSAVSLPLASTIDRFFLKLETVQWKKPRKWNVIKD